MNERLTTVTQALTGRFDGRVEEFRGEVTLFLPPEQVVPAALAARDEFGFEMMLDETAVDYYPETEPRFHIIYQLYSVRDNQLLRLRVPVNEAEPHLPTMVTVYPVANWKEREIWDMFGVRFDGHPDMRRILMPHDWQGHPLRKDYPLGYEEVQFTFNVEEIDLRKPYAKD